MKRMNIRGIIAIGACCVALGLSTYGAAGGGRASIGPPDLDPTAGPIEVFATAGSDEVAPGGVFSLDVAIVNHSDTLTVRVVLLGEIEYASGQRQHLFLDSPHVLGPKGAVVMLGFAVVPDSAALGTATLSAIAIATSIPGAGPTHSDVFIARDSDSFDVVSR
jgi:hypothetical protein